MAELVLASGTSAVTIKAYVRRGLLARVPFYGNATRYPREHLLRLLAITCLKAQGFKSLDEVRRKLDAWSPAETERWILEFPLHATALAALGYSEQKVPVSAKAIASSGGAAGTAKQASHRGPEEVGATLPNESWRRMVLLPGLELHLEQGAAPVTVRLAERLLAVYTSLMDG
jgi:DNA-binding transcriptional MerR regulator